MKINFILLLAFTMIFSCENDNLERNNILDDAFEDASNNENLISLIVFKDGNITLAVQAPESFAAVKAEHYNAPEDKPVSLLYRLKMFLSLRDQRSA